MTQSSGHRPADVDRLLASIGVRETTDVPADERAQLIAHAPAGRGFLIRGAQNGGSPFYNVLTGLVGWGTVVLGLAVVASLYLGAAWVLRQVAQPTTVIGGFVRDVVVASRGTGSASAAPSTPPSTVTKVRCGSGVRAADALGRLAAVAQGETLPDGGRRNRRAHDGVGVQTWQGPSGTLRVRMAGGRVSTAIALFRAPRSVCAALAANGLTPAEGVVTIDAAGVVTLGAGARLPADAVVQVQREGDELRAVQVALP